MWGSPSIVDPSTPQAVLNAVIVRAMLDEAYSQGYADMFAEFRDPSVYQWCDMPPVVRVATVLHPDRDTLCPDDLWYVEVQYSTRGGRAGYGVDRNHVATCYCN